MPYPLISNYSSLSKWLLASECDVALGAALHVSENLVLKLIFQLSLTTRLVLRYATLYLANATELKEEFELEARI